MDQLWRPDCIFKNAKAKPPVLSCTVHSEIVNWSKMAILSFDTELFFSCVLKQKHSTLQIPFFRLTKLESIFLYWLVEFCNISYTLYF
jgi:hypothetical protein